MSGISSLRSLGIGGLVLAVGLPGLELVRTFAHGDGGNREEGNGAEVGEVDLHGVTDGDVGLGLVPERGGLVHGNSPFVVVSIILRVNFAR